MAVIASPIRKNDNVIVTAGRDRGKRGRVLRVLPDKGRVIVEGVNFIKRHTKANPQKNIKGGIVEREAALSASNVQIVCPECGAATRVGSRRLDAGGRVRFCRKCKGVIDK
jgi:large subunit ribosomal protein L24